MTTFYPVQDEGYIYGTSEPNIFEVYMEKIFISYIMSWMVLLPPQKNCYIYFHIQVYSLLQGISVNIRLLI